MLFIQNNNNNSRFTSATTRCDEIEDFERIARNRKEDFDEMDPRKMVLMSNIENEAWKKELEKVGKGLDEFDENEGKDKEKFSNGDDFKSYLKELNLASIVKKKFIEHFLP